MIAANAKAEAFSMFVVGALPIEVSTAQRTAEVHSESRRCPL